MVNQNQFNKTQRCFIWNPNSTAQEKIETVKELVLCFWNSSKINYRQQRSTTLNICNFFTSPNIQKYLGAKKPKKY